MSALFRIVYAAHANGTHHKLALDALNALQGDDAEAWRRLFLKHVALYLEGSKAPDVSFKDFRNHVLHVGDKYWGGAPEKAEAWYAHTVAALRAQNWPDAAYAAGVLSHYYTDPVHPFHTGQTEAENAIHRAVEWSINRSYDTLRAVGERDFGDVDMVVPEGEGWLRAFVCDGAEFSHRYYEKLIAHYDVHRGVVRPEEGLDAVAQKIVAELLMYASTGFARVLDHAITEASVAAPAVTLTVETVLAGLTMPRKWLEKKLANADDRVLVRTQYEELVATGRVERTLADDERAIRDAHAREVLQPKLASRSETRVARMQAGDPGASRRVRPTGAANPVAPPATAGTRAGAVPTRASPVQRISTAAPPPAQEPQRSYLATSDNLEAAPSIGPKMAARFAELGIKAVADFLSNAPQDMAELLDDNRVDAATLADWQDQARLVIDIAGLRGGAAQLLVGAGYRTAGSIAEADAVQLSADVLRFAATREGKRILRTGEVPDLEKIKAWVEFAREAMAA